MLSYLTVTSPDCAPTRQVNYNGIARLFAEHEPETATEPPATVAQRLTDAWSKAMAPIREMIALLRDEESARRVQSRG